MFIPRLNLRYDAASEFVFRDDGEVEIVSQTLKGLISDAMGIDIFSLEVSEFDDYIMVFYDEEKLLFRFSEDGVFPLEAEWSQKERQVLRR